MDDIKRANEPIQGLEIGTKWPPTTSPWLLATTTIATRCYLTVVVIVVVLVSDLDWTHAPDDCRIVSTIATSRLLSLLTSGKNKHFGMAMGQCRVRSVCRTTSKLDKTKRKKERERNYRLWPSKVVSALISVFQ